MAWERGSSCEFIKKACKQHETSYKLIALDKIVMAQGKSNATLLNCWLNVVNTFASYIFLENWCKGQL